MSRRLQIVEVSYSGQIKLQACKREVGSSPTEPHWCNCCMLHRPSMQFGSCSSYFPSFPAGHIDCSSLISLLRNARWAYVREILAVLRVSRFRPFCMASFELSIQHCWVHCRSIRNPASLRSAPLCRACFIFAIHIRCCSQHVAFGLGKSDTPSFQMRR
jgi:hypothetical protein